MGKKLHRFIGVLKKATFISSPSSSSDIAVHRATSHLNPSSPPRPHHIAALLSFGNGARPVATSLSSSLASRLLSTRNPSVALKSLLSLHHLLRSAPFILLDSLLSSLLPNSSGRFTRSPLLLSSFPLGSNPNSWSLSNLVRWYSSLLELRLILPERSSDVADHVSSLLTRDLIAELDVMVKFYAVAVSSPEMPEGNRLVAEVMRVVEEDRVAVEDGIRVRVNEVKERIGEIGFGDAVELVLVLRRMDDCGSSDERLGDVDGRIGVWKDVKEVRGMVEEIAVRAEKEARVVRRERAGWVSERFAGQAGEPVLFGSNRWVQH